MFCKPCHKVSEARGYKTSLSLSPHTPFFMDSWNGHFFLFLGLCETHEMHSKDPADWVYAKTRCAQDLIFLQTLVIILTSLPGNPWREEVYAEPSSILHFYQSKCVSFLPPSFTHQPWVLTPGPVSALAVLKQQEWVAQLTDLEEQGTARLPADTRRPSWL